MGNIVKFPKPPHQEKAATCGCGGQTFILICDDNEQPEFAYCVECQHIASKIKWGWQDPLPGTEQWPPETIA